MQSTTKHLSNIENTNIEKPSILKKDFSQSWTKKFKENI